ncbi:MAG: hypothetical protein V3S14_14195 [Anaerolineae bacterium]
MARCSIDGAALSLVQRDVRASLSSAWQISPTPLPSGREMEDLRARLLADPYFGGVPSMQPEARKTALAFHAKDDLPEVRREVFSLLLRHQMHFFAVVRDNLVRRLFRDRLHKDDEYEIFFAKRGKSDRTKALLEAQQAASNRFSQRWGIVSEAPIHVFPTTPPKCPDLQAPDRRPRHLDGPP